MFCYILLFAGEAGSATASRHETVRDESHTTSIAAPAVDFVVEVLPSSSCIHSVGSQDVLFSSGFLGSDYPTHVSCRFVNCETAPLPLDFWVENSNDSNSVEIPLVPQLSSFLSSSHCTLSSSTEADFLNVATLQKETRKQGRAAAHECLVRDDGSDKNMFSDNSDDDSLHDPTFCPDSSEGSSDDEYDACDTTALDSKSALTQEEASGSTNAAMLVSQADDSAVGILDENNNDTICTPTLKRAPGCDNDMSSEAGSAVAYATETASNVVVITTSNIDRRTYDKASYCFYCAKPQKKLPRHLKKKHSTEQDVEHLLAEEDRTKRNIALLKLRNLGNHRHNFAVVSKQEGDFIVAYRPKLEATDYRHYTPCRYCYGYFAKDTIWKHLCPFAPKSVDGKAIPRLRKGACDLMTTGSASMESNSGFASLLNGLRDDEVGKLVQKDYLILQLGRDMCTKFGGDMEQFSYIRFKMRQAAKILQKIRQSSGINLTMSDCIDPKKFSDVVNAAQQCAGLDEAGSQYTTPSVALKCGGLLKKLAEIKHCQSLEREDMATADKCTSFLTLCQKRWPDSVSSVALRNIADRKRTGVLCMPLTEDVITLNQYLVSEANRLISINPATIDDVLLLTQVILAKVIIFNRKRQGEVSKIKLADYQAKRKADNSEVTLALTDFERALLQTLERIEIRGKCGRTVPVLLTKEMIQWIDHLLMLRKSASVISETNIFLFATLGEHAHFRGSDAMRKFAAECKAKQPHLLTSTKLRKHVASLAQVLSLQPNELDSLATFMGHDLRVHTQYYRLPFDIMQIARISKIFIAAEKGKIGEFAGKELKDITVDDTLSESSDEDSELSDLEEGQQDSNRCIQVASSSSGNLQQVMQADCIRKVRRTVPKVHMQKVSSDKDDTSLDLPIPVVSSSQVALPAVADASECVKKAKSNKLTQRRPWTDGEKEAVRLHFASDIMNKKLPGKSAIEAFLKISQLNREWKNVKDHIRNTYLS